MPMTFVLTGSNWTSKFILEAVNIVVKNLNSLERLNASLTFKLGLPEHHAMHWD